MKGLIDHYIISLDKIEKELRKDSNEKATLSIIESNYTGVSDEDLDNAITKILEGNNCV
ncbi:hypothetical protein [Flavobacterium sp. IMCC34518]|uniref:hypothetical protein n=1 Tax=Flavobacterium sp. IMCC34518 TaxID=3003623 RepID=UPI0022ABFAEF|nr:hypothetical protein [Flavobacterium sp. IMCC34518]